MFRVEARYDPSDKGYENATLCETEDEAKAIRSEWVSRGWGSLKIVEVDRDPNTGEYKEVPPAPAPEQSTPDQSQNGN